MPNREFLDPEGYHTLTQEALAAAAEIDMRYVGGIERGQENPTVSVLGRLAGALGVTPDALFRGDQ
jgi:transcriptional regulator with XRE-family HTH domain